MSEALIEASARYDAIRTQDWTYVEHGTGERELYDLALDPYQLDNRAKTADPALIAALSERVAALARCAAAECRRIEDLPGPAAAPPVLVEPEPEAKVVPAALTK